MELYLARHGETISNAESRLTGRWTNSPLSDKGVEQARLLGKSLEHIAFDVVYSSPLKRAIDTVDVAFGNRYKVIIDERLAEINLGVMEGETYEAVSVLYPESGMLFFTDPLSYKAPPKGEDLNDMIKRVDSFLCDVSRAKQNRVFVLTHGYVLRVMYACAVDKTIASIAKAPAYSNCETVCYTYGNGKWELLNCAANVALL